MSVARCDYGHAPIGIPEPPCITPKEAALRPCARFTTAPAVNITSRGLAFESPGQLAQLEVALQSGLWTVVSAGCAKSRQKPRPWSRPQGGNSSSCATNNSGIVAFCGRQVGEDWRILGQWGHQDKAPLIWYNWRRSGLGQKPAAEEPGKTHELWERQCWI